MLQVNEINDADELPALRDTWSDLLAQTQSADFFRTHAWLTAYWNHYGVGQRLRLLTVHDQQQLVGIVPLTVVPRPTRLGNFRVLAFPLDYWGSFYGPVGPQPAQCMRAALKYLLHSDRDWDYLDLRWLPETGDAAGAIAAAAQTAGVQLRPRQDDTIAIANLGAGWEAYWSSRSRNWRSNCRRNAKKTEASGDVQYIRYRPDGARHGDDDPRWDLYEQVQHIAQRSWQAGSEDGTTMSHQGVRRFLRELHVTAAREGRLDLNLLRIDGEPVAFNYNYHYRGRVSSLRLGFTPEFARVGAGTVLTWRMLEDSCQRGDHTVDFLPGSLGVKRPWQTSLERSVRYEYMPFRLGRLELLRAKRWLSEQWQTVRETWSLSG